MTETVCGATGWVHGVPVTCDMRLNHPEVEGHFDSFAGLEFK